MARSSVALILSGLALVVSSVSLTWSIAQHLLSGARLRVGVHREPRSDSDWMWTPHVVVRVANVGRQPVTVTQVAVRVSHRRFVSLDQRTQLGDPLPARLEPGAQLQVYVGTEQLVQLPDPRLWPVSRWRFAAVPAGRSPTYSKRNTVPGEVRAADAD